MRAAAVAQQRQRAVKLGVRVLGQRQHNVAADLVKPGLPRPSQRLRSPGGRVGAPNRRSWASSELCTPKLMRVTPAALNPRSVSDVTMSGFASKVISAPGKGAAA